jgi:ABC-type nitrate/sulfonate/bicarbonate transport system substrate-binding protein
MARCLLAIILALGILTPARAAELQPLRVIVFAGGLSWPVFAAQDAGLFERHGLAVEVTETPGSLFQITNLYDGKFDVAMTPFDNLVAYQEGQGETILPGQPDLFAFMGGLSNGLRLIADPKIKTIPQLKGQTVGIDAATSGYALIMYDLLERQGVPFGSYTLQKAGGTTFRVQALEAGKIAATMVSSPQEIGPEEKGFTRLGDVLTTVGTYQASCGVARRSWAAANPDKLKAYIAAYMDADAWLRDPANHEAALATYLKHVRGSTHESAEKALKIMLSPNEGFQPRAAFDPKGAETVLAVRTKYGTPKKPLKEWAAYVDDRFYREVAGKQPSK